METYTVKGTTYRLESWPDDGDPAWTAEQRAKREAMLAKAARQTAKRDRVQQQWLYGGQSGSQALTPRPNGTTVAMEAPAGTELSWTESGEQHTGSVWCAGGVARSVWVAVPSERRYVLLSYAKWLDQWRWTAEYGCSPIAA